tara:strand:+ start:615 stop:1829 length:1215 start_codon:yes stop_codon:yes gene_type:complete
MEKRSVVICLTMLLILGLAPVDASIGITGDIVSDFGLDVSSILLKVVVTQGDSVEKVIKVSNEKGGEHTLRITGLEGVSLGEDNFVLDKGEEREVSINFDSNSLDPGVYIGQIRIANNGEEVLLPIAFEVESVDVFFDMNLDIPPQYTVVSPGERISVKVTIFDLTGFQGAGSLGPTNIEVEYILSSVSGAILSSEEEGVVVDGRSQFTKTLFLPENIEEGGYFFSVIGRYKSSVGTSSQLLSVKDEGRSLGNFFSGSDSNFLIFLVFMIILFLGIIFVFVYLIRSRDKMYSELRRYNSHELRGQKRFLSAQRKIIKKKKTLPIKTVRKEISHKIKKLKHKQAERVEVFKKLKKANKTSAMRKKLNEWKRSGYKNSKEEYKLNGLSSKEMKGLINKWKGEGYRP